MKTVGWMVNLTMRRVERVVSEESALNSKTYGRYRGPKRTYMLHDQQVFDTERLAMKVLFNRMLVRYAELAAKAAKYRTELDSVKGAIEHMERKP